MNKIIFIILFISLIFTQSDSEEGGVQILTDDNFDSKIAEFGVTLVKFYAPWCGHCKKLAPEYSAAALELKQLDTPVYLSQVDCTVEKKLAEKYEIQGFPTLKLFKNGKILNYEGGRTREDIVKYMKKHTGPIANELICDKYDKIINTKINKIIIAINDLQSKEYISFIDAAAQIEDGEFYYIIDKKCAESKGYIIPSITLLVDGNAIIYDGKYIVDDIVLWIHGNELPPVIEFSQDTARKLFGPQQTIHHQLLLFGTKDKYKSLLTDYTKLAKEYSGRVLFVYVPPEEGRIYEYFGLETNTELSLMAVHMGQNMKKYKYENKEYNYESIGAFTKQFIDGEITPFLKSEDIPESQTGPVIKIVGKSFEKIALDKSKNVFIKFYAPWCGHCKALAPIYIELAEKLKDHDDIIIAEFDATANEVDHPDVNIRGYPTLKLFKSEDNKVIDFEGERDINGMINFLEKNIPNFNNIKIDEKTEEEL